MNIYFGCFQLKPNRNSAVRERVEGAWGHCWVRDHDAASAMLKAAYKISQGDWEIVGIEQEMIVVNRSNFAGKDLGEQNYDIALEKGMSIGYVAWAGEKQKLMSPTQERLQHRDDFNLAKDLSELKDRHQRGECLHYDAPNGCDDVINAHSIQKRGALAAVAAEGMVYVPSLNLSDLSRQGMFSFVKKGIAAFSTFRGFCKKHDNELFSPIDDQMFAATDEQIALLAYRALSREVFLKKRSVEGFNKRAADHTGAEATRVLLTETARASQVGLTNLLRQKELFDRSCRGKCFNDFRAAVFISESKPDLAFSSVLFPDYGFRGEPLQDLGGGRNLDLITFSFAPMGKEWAFVFAWHQDSSRTCVQLLSTLANAYQEGTSLEDSLFRYIVCQSENIAFSPEWWESKPIYLQEEITKAATYCADILSIPTPILPGNSLKGVSDWNFQRVISKYSALRQ